MDLDDFRESARLIERRSAFYTTGGAALLEARSPHDVATPGSDSVM